MLHHCQFRYGVPTFCICIGVRANPLSIDELFGMIFNFDQRVVMFQGTGPAAFKSSVNASYQGRDSPPKPYWNLSKGGGHRGDNGGGGGSYYQNGGGGGAGHY